MDATTAIDGSEDVLDSRDIIERIEYLESIAEDDELDEQEQAERASLKALADEGIAEWTYGAMLIHADYFTGYCEEWCTDLGYISDDLPAFIADNINWDDVASDLMVDYSEVRLMGSTYYVRA